MKIYEANVICSSISPATQNISARVNIELNDHAKHL